MSATPMMQQYQSIRRTLPEGTLLFFRLGDFYELFFEDAKIAAPILNVALTKRHGMPMCGVPFHAADGYIGRLIKAGLRVAICDQTSEPQPGRIVERQVSQIISPGTVSDLQLLESRQNNFLAAVGRQASGSAKRASVAGLKLLFGLAFLDISTGEFRVTEVNSFNAREDKLARFNPSEILVPDSDPELIGKIPRASSYDGYTFELDQASYVLHEQFCVQSLDGFGCSEMTAAIGAAGAIVHYLRHQLRRRTSHIRSLGVFLSDQHVALDVATQQNLELIRSKGTREDSSLLAALDRTMTPMGGRLFRQWLLKPLRSRAEIRQRQEMIQQLLDTPFLLSSVRGTLNNIRDIERTVGRLSQLSGNARDVVALRLSLESLPELKGHLAALAKAVLAEGDDLLLNQIVSGIHELPELVRLLSDALVEEPPALLKEGGMFRDGYDAELDELRGASRSGKDWIAALQQREIERTGIKSLKVRFNSVFGYFIEVSNSILGSVPADYTRKQTTVGGERFITPELKEAESKILEAERSVKALAYDLFLRLRENLLEYLPQLQEIARS